MYNINSKVQKAVVHYRTMSYTEAATGGFL